MSEPHDDQGMSPDEELERMIRETEQALNDLRAELAAHREQRDQEAMIDQLPQLLDITKDKWRNVGIFIEELTDEMKNHRNHPYYELRDDDDRT